MAGKRGYVLLELIGVMAIVFIIAGLLTSSVRLARMKSLEAVCIQNERQLTTAVILYSLDHEIFPQEIALVKPYLPENSFLPTQSLSEPMLYAADNTIRNYYDNLMEVTRCPMVEGYVTDEPPIYSYGINYYIKNKNYSYITDPSVTIVLIESNKKTVVKFPQQIAYRHFGGALAGYADGHVEKARSYVYIDYDKGHGNDPGGVDPDNPAIIKGQGAKA